AVGPRLPRAPVPMDRDRVQAGPGDAGPRPAVPPLPAVLRAEQRLPGPRRRLRPRRRDATHPRGVRAPEAGDAAGPAPPLGTGAARRAAEQPRAPRPGRPPVRRMAHTGREPRRYPGARPPDDGPRRLARDGALRRGRLASPLEPPVAGARRHA